MKTRITEHIISIVLVGGVLLSLFFAAYSSKSGSNKAATLDIQNFLELDYIDYTNPYHKTLLGEVLNIFYPEDILQNKAVAQKLFDYKDNELLNSVQTKHLSQTMSWVKFRQLTWMYIKFLIIYISVLLFTYYGVQTMGVWRFIKNRQAVCDTTQIQKAGEGVTISRYIISFFGSAGKFLGSLILFSPAYVIAYSLRTDFNTDMMLFIIILGVVSNGLLINYANKFYSFLKTESRKGYVETALAKGLQSSYTYGSKGTISWGDILQPVKSFKGHVLGHIFANARLQYLSTVKEQAVFLITGLVIIEMALNIHGYISYEMLQQLLYGNWDIVIIILFFLFNTVKFTELITDYLVHKTFTRFNN